MTWSKPPPESRNSSGDLLDTYAEGRFGRKRAEPCRVQATLVRGHEPDTACLVADW